MMWWNHGGWVGGDWLAMGIIMVIFWGLVIALVGWLVWGRRPDRGPAEHPSSDSTQAADEVLAAQFARGEIDQDEFTKRRQVLHPTSRRR